MTASHISPWEKKCFFSYKELESENISRYRKISSISLLGMKQFKIKKTFKNGLTDSLTYKDNGDIKILRINHPNFLYIFKLEYFYS